MKKLLALFVLISYGAIAQDITDALRFSSQSISGTARYTAMGGAFGALGGDISAIHINPASSAVFLTNRFSGSLDLTSVNNDAFYGGNAIETRNTNFDLNQIGAVFVFEPNNRNAALQKLTLGFSYNRTANFNNQYFVNGNNSESIDAFFLNSAQGVPLDLLTPRNNETPAQLYRFLGNNEGFGTQQAFLGYETFLIDAVDPNDLNNTGYVSNVSGTNFNHSYDELTRGSSGVFTVNAGGMIGDRLHLGLNLNFHYLDYRRETLFDEFGSGQGVTEIFFDNELFTRGRGFSLQLGGIAKLTEDWRLGFTYDSPTWMSISEELFQSLETVTGGNQSAFFNPDVLNIYPDYRFRTPGRVSLSTAYVFGGRGLISFDYSYKDFSAMEFTSRGFEIQNQEISNLMTGASTFNIGGEYRLQNTSLRAGYFHQQSPYQNKAFLSDTNGYSFGLGFNLGFVNLDFSYQRIHQDRQGILYFTDLAQESDIISVFNNYMMTLSFNL